MRRLLQQRRSITPAQRGQIVQRVLVDGWSARQAAATAGVDERQVAAWVAAYRRHGMASLRHDPHPASLWGWRLLRPLAKLWRGLAMAPGGRDPRPASAMASALPRPRDDRRGGG